MGTQHIPSLCVSTMNNCLAPFKELLRRINTGYNVPPVSCIVSNAVMSFTIDAAKELGVPDVGFWTASACGLMAFLQFPRFIEKGLTPFKGAISHFFFKFNFTDFNFTDFLSKKEYIDF